MRARESSSQTSSTGNSSANAVAGKQTTLTSPVLSHRGIDHHVDDTGPMFVAHELASAVENAADSILREPVNGDASSKPHNDDSDQLWNGQLRPAQAAESNLSVPTLANLETANISHGQLLTTSEEVSSFEFPTPVSGLALENIVTHDDSQYDVDMEIPNQVFDDFWYWLGDFDNDMGPYGSFESQSGGLSLPRTSDSTKDSGSRAGAKPRKDSMDTAYRSEISDESPDAPSPWPLSWTPRQMDAGLPATEATGILDCVLEMEDFAHVGRLTFEKYEEIVENLQNHANQPIYRSFGNPVLPSAEVMNSFIQLYFEHFHDTMPFIHKPSFHPSKEHWIFVLSVAATGCRFSQIPRSDLYALKLTELVRRSIMVVVSQSAHIARNHPRHMLINTVDLSWK